MDTKLKNITTQYRKFNENQALTEGQLNEFIDYFEDQDRLSRTRLSGVGLVCGLKSTYSKSIFQDPSDPRRKNEPRKTDINNLIDINPITITQGAGVATDGELISLHQENQPVPRTKNQPKKADIPDLIDINPITITQGAGVTTDGDLITLRQKDQDTGEISIDFESQSYTYFTEYIDTVNYPHFFKGKNQMPLVELLTTQQYNALIAQGSTKTIYPLDRKIDFSSRIIILYLESYSNEESPCQDADCDNQGAEQVSNLRILLADPKSIYTYMLNGDAKDSIYKLHNSYEILYDNLPNIEAKRVILDPSITTASQLKAKFQDAIQAASTVSDLSEGFTAIAEAFNVNLNLGSQTLYDKLYPILTTTGPNLDDYQYRYDLLKDLIDTYNEIKGLLLHLKAECCPSITSFPKHLMLGPVGASLELGDHTLYRHDFYNSPINTNDDENHEKLLMLASRFLQKINGFRSFIGPLKITPSNMYVTLGEKAIPYYFNVDQNLLKKWNFEKTKTNKQTYNLSYHTASLASDDFVQNPLYYNIDNNDFYRIESVVGTPFEIALQNINDLKAKYGLAFDAIGLVLQKGKTTTPDPRKTTLESKNEPTVVSIKGLRDQLYAISSDISNQVGNTQSTLQTISSLDSQLKLLNAVEYAQSQDTTVSVLKQDTKKTDVVSELLSEFVERKPGLEHLAGVEPGGTFVMVYESETNNKVLADFALPYVCCSKKDPVFLVLPATTLCQNDAPIPMTIVPLDGEVKAFANGVQINNAVTQVGGQNMFNPGSVGTTQLGQTITFTVNDDPVDAQMVVYKKPEIVSVTSGSITYDIATTDVNTTNPDATVEFNVVGDFTGLTFTWNFGDGTPIIEKEAPTSKKTHIYNLISGQEETYNPTLTVTNGNGCSTLYQLAPLKLTGQSTIACLSGMRVVIQYRDGVDPYHSCNRGSFKLKGNGNLIEGINPFVDPTGVIKGNIHFSNNGQNQDRLNYPPNVTSGASRYNEVIITQEEAEDLAAGASNGFVQFSLECALPDCHTSVAFTQLFLANDPTPIYSGYPNGNFLEINPCTGATR